LKELHFKCKECGKITKTYLKAKNPFNKTDDIFGCPNCKGINTLYRICDEPNCKEIAICGFPTDKGYRNTCGKHYKKL